MAVKDPKKLARRVFREYGAVVHEHDEHDATVYLFPDNMRIPVPKNATMAWVAARCREVQGRYGKLSRNYTETLTARSGKPVIDFERIEATEHAKERLTLMRKQQRIEFREVLNCLRIPERVLWSDVHNSWLWVRDRLAVAVTEDGLRIKSILWSTNELFEANPRPKESA